jgi:acetolactate synthase small subunit
MVAGNVVENEVLIKVLKNTSTFSFSEICKILEVNNVKLFSIALVDSSNKDIEAIVSVDTEDLTTALRLLREFEYEVLSNHEEDDFFKDLKDRSKYLEKYLNI